MVRALFGRRRIEEELDDELRDHLARDIAHRVSRGASPAEARRLALADLGGVERTRDDVRDVHGITLLDALRRDVRLALRRLWRQKGYTALTVATLALGIGAATAVFTVVYGVLLRPLPLPEPDRLVTLWQANVAQGVVRDDVAPATFFDWHERLAHVVTLGGANPYSVSLRGATATDRLDAWLVSGDFFSLLGVTPYLGRALRPDDFVAGSAPVVLLDHGLWLRRFGGDSSIVGRVLHLDDRSVEVVGVMPPGFELPARTSLWLPWVPDESERADRFGTYIRVFGRLRDGVTLPQAAQAQAAVARDLERLYPRSNTGVTGSVVPLIDVMVGAQRPLLYTLLSAAGVLLLVTLANIAALHLTRVARQRRESAIRTALGAGRRALVRPLATEAFLLALLGAAGGAAVAWALVRVLHVLGPTDLPRLADVAFGGASLAVVAALAVAATVVMTIIAIGRATTGGVGALSSRSVAGSPLARRGRQAAVGLQLAFSLVLLIGTSLLVRSFVRVLSADRGYDTANTLSFSIWVYDEYANPGARITFARNVLERLRALPGVRSAALGSALPLAGRITGEDADVVMEGTAVAPGEEEQARGIAVWPTYFETLGIARRAGRLFLESDEGSSEPVVVVNEAFVRRFSPDRDAVGRMVAVGLMGRAIPRRIVGVVADTRHASPDAAADAGVYIPWLQQPIAAMNFVVRTAGPGEALAPAVTRLMFELDSRLGLGNLTTMDALLDQRLRERRLLLLLLAAFAASAMLLAAVGVFGVTTQSVVERRREIGVRLALGATPGSIVREISREALRLAAVGCIGGLALAAAGTHAIARFLYEVAPFDPLAFVGAAAVLMAAALVAALTPLRRAARTNPLIVMQAE